MRIIAQVSGKTPMGFSCHICQGCTHDRAHFSNMIHVIPIASASSLRASVRRLLRSLTARANPNSIKS